MIQPPRAFAPPPPPFPAPAPPPFPAPAPPRSNRWAPVWARVVAWVFLAVHGIGVALGAMAIEADLTDGRRDMFDGLGVALGGLTVALALFSALWWVLFLALKRVWLFAVAAAITVQIGIWPLVVILTN